MCGIAGFVGLGDRADIEAMTHALAHRGPDGDGFHLDPDNHVWLGHRRLAIRDIAGGHQPMWNAAKTIGVIFNGEIYNYEELRAGLTARGHVFATSHSDTEVLVHGYAEWGEGLAARLNGMFAFAVLDLRQRRLYLARDRFGEKPLYYGLQPGLFAFASELNALVLHRDIAAQPSSVAVQKLFAYGYIPAPYALYEKTYKLPGGHWMTVGLDGLDISIRKYWQFEFAPDENMRQRGEDELAEQLWSLIAEATRRRLVSDVPLGVFLSGGLDSSAILLAAAKARPPGEVATFTIGFTEPSYDESGYARAVAGLVGSNHHERILDFDLARTLIPAVLDRLGEPLGDPSILPTHMLCAYARENVTVALSGDGGDELFAGYDPFAALAPAAAYSRLMPKSLHRMMRALAEAMPRSGRNLSLDFKVRRTLMGLSQPESAWAPVWMAPLDPDDAKKLFDGPLSPEEVYGEAMDLWETGSARTRVDRLLQFFTQFYLQDDILAKVDRAAMMSSLETRAVFLDNDVVDFCQRLPSDFKYRKGVRKYLLKKALARALPPHIVGRKKKGFGIPVSDWLKRIDWTASPADVPGLKTAWIDRAFMAHRDGRADHRLLLWTYLGLQRTLAQRQPAPARA